MWNHKTAAAVLRKKNKVGEITIPDIKLYYKAMVLITVWCGHKNSHIDQWNYVSPLYTMKTRCIHVTVEQNREPRNKPKSLWSINIWQRGRSIKWSKTTLFNKWCWDIWAATYKENEIWPPTYTIHKNKLKIGKRLKCKSWYHKSPRGEHTQENLRYSMQQYFHQYVP